MVYNSRLPWASGMVPWENSEDTVYRNLLVLIQEYMTFSIVLGRHLQIAGTSCQVHNTTYIWD